MKRLKSVFTEEPVLAVPDLDREMRVKADTSDYAIEEVLSVSRQPVKFWLNK